MKADVVIGAGYGDEGKGLMTDYLASQHEESIVIRFNGGAQAGHTVQTPDGRAHVFSHFSSGSYVGAHTYLSQFFIVNPITFTMEGMQLIRNLCNIPKVTIHPHAMVTTPFDMMTNQVMSRGATCGMGINETVVRHEYLPLTMANLASWDFNRIKSYLKEIRDFYTIPRLVELKLTAPPSMMMDELIDNYLRDVQILLSTVTVGKLKPTSIPLIFEGAQGLLLDNDYDLVYGTPSKTGLANVVKIARELGIEGLNVNYMTRAYMTRHGKGPFPTHNDKLSYEDRTNITNTFQGSLRFGIFDYDQINSVIQSDFNSSAIETTGRLVVTHLDQVPPFVEIKAHDTVYAIPRDTMAKFAARDMGLDSYAESYGPTRKDVRCPSS